MKTRILMGVIGAILALLVLMPVDKTLLTGISFAVLVIVNIVMYAMKKITKIHAYTSGLAWLTVFIILIFYLMPAWSISMGSGTVLTDNWWNALNWIENNTQECAVVATYWDPGHFIRAIAHRSVVFDGASQNDLLIIPYNGTKSGLEITPYDSGIKQIINYKDGQEIHARIKDIGISLLTSNESLAIDVLKNYRRPGCDEMYYIASSDLIFKSQWWSYFATWDPTKEGQKGTTSNYIIAQLSQKKPLISLGVMGYEYPISQQQSFILCQQNGTVGRCSNDTIGLFQQGSEFARLKKLILPVPPYTIEDPSGEMPGEVIVLDQGGQTIAYLSPELENAMFTRMMLFDGAGLQNFEFVKSWGSEIKLYKIKFNETA